MATAFQFGDPQPSPDNFNNFSKADLLADTSVKASQVIQPVPAARLNPPVMSLDSILGAAATAQIQAAGEIALHVLGDTGGIKSPEHQFAVADALVADLGAATTYADGRQAFFYHLGDVVYYCGQEQYYYDQFYDPYRDYDAPIFAIPGNHDGCVFSGEKVPTLAAFQENFCASQPTRNPDAQGVWRTTMTQPGVYFTLNAPFVKIIGLYSNVGEGATSGVISGPAVGQAQLTFLQNELKAAAAQRAKAGAAPFALIIATHHPPFTGSSSHAPSPEMLKEIDAACQAANIWPDMHWSGHAHLYERFTRTVSGRDIPYLVAGMGGYPNLSGLKKGAKGQTVQAGTKGTDGSGNPLVVECYNNTTFGYMRINISPATVTVEFLGVDEDNQKAEILDSFSLNLKTHKVSNTKAGSSAVAKKMSTQAHGTKPKKARKK
jgi:hypothetical protein